MRRIWQEVDYGLVLAAAVLSEKTFLLCMLANLNKII